MEAARKVHGTFVGISTCVTTLPRAWTGRRGLLRKGSFLWRKISAVTNLWPGRSAEMCRGFLLYKFWRILPGIFLEDFSGHFSHKNEEKKSGNKIREKDRRPKNRNPRKIRSAENRPQKTCVSKWAPREFRSWRVQGNPPTLCQPFANLSPTLLPTPRQPFANPFCQPLSNPLFPWTPKHPFRDTGWRFLGRISEISNISKFSRISRQWPDSPLFSTVWGFSRYL